jgi:hypothetical protein
LNYKKLAAAVSATALVVGALLGGAASAIAASGDSYDPQLIPGMTPAQVGVVINDNMGNDFSIVGVRIPPRVAGTNFGAWHWCQTLDEPECDFAKATTEIGGTSVLPNCPDGTSEFCVKGLELAAPGKEFEPATFERRANSATLPPSPKYGYPGGSSPSLFTASSVPSAGGLTTYAARVSLSLSFDKASNKFVFPSLTAAVQPYRGIQDPDIPGTNGNSTHGHVCFFVEKGACGVPQDWVPGTKARLTFRVPSTIAGWFKGRIQTPNITITKISDAVNEISVEAQPVSVPQLSLVKNQSDLSSVESSGANWGGPNGMYIGTTSWAEDVAAFIDRYREPLHDSATGVATFWNLSSMNTGNGSQCLQDSSRVLGIVTTNAMGYDGSSPSFSDGFLNYHVSGLHFAPDGVTPNEGTYDLVMRSDTARCLYGFTKAPISATVSVISAAGEQKTAVTTVNEKDGWLSMRAYGFTFSNPVVKVQITQAKDASAGSSSSAGSSTITCFKGKLTKKVAGTARKCPAGFKKK